MPPLAYFDPTTVETTRQVVTQGSSAGWLLAPILASLAVAAGYIRTKLRGSKKDTQKKRRSDR